MTYPQFYEFSLVVGYMTIKFSSIQLDEAIASCQSRHDSPIVLR
ncbi:hypothetical protein [Atlanticothrix silvestris]|nr:hypothetical protein [Atlanticothrix silvestris]